ncbi:MAG: hypothetical protein SGPRY_010372 [Prymnesium sp.]
MHVDGLGPVLSWRSPNTAVSDTPAAHAVALGSLQLAAGASEWASPLPETMPRSLVNECGMSVSWGRGQDHQPASMPSSLLLVAKDSDTRDRLVDRPKRALAQRLEKLSALW